MAYDEVVVLINDTPWSIQSLTLAHRELATVRG